MSRGRNRPKREIRPLEELEFYPTDPLTGLALSVHVTADDFVGPEEHGHHKNFGEKRPELQGVGGKAVRYSDVQFLPGHLHHVKYEGSVHDVFQGPEKLPRRPEGQIIHATLSLARVIPRDGVDLKSDDPTTPRRFTDKEYEFVSSPWITNVEGAFRRSEIFKRHEIGRFYAEHALQEEILVNVVGRNERIIFLNAREESRIRELGNQIIRNAVKEVLKPANSLYQQAKAEGMVRGNGQDLVTVVSKVLPNYKLPEHYPRLRKVLSSEEYPESEMAA